MSLLVLRLRQLHPLQRVAVGLWIALFVGVFGRLLLGPARSHTVVPIYLTAADRWTHGESLYAPAPPLDIYRNPPGVAAAFVPLTLLPERLAEVVWRGLGAAAFLAALAAWVRWGLPRPLTPGESGAVFALAVLPALLSLNNGQTNLVIIAALMAGATAAARGYASAAGLALATAAALKVYPLCVGLLVALTAPRRLLPPLVLAGLGFALIPFVLQDPEYVASQYRSFWDYLGTDDRSFAAVGRAPQDLFFVLRMWAVPPPKDLYLALRLVIAVVMAGVVLIVARRDRGRADAVPLAFSLGCVWVTVLGPATEPHTYALLGPSAASLIATTWRTASRSTRWSALLGYGLLVAPIVRDMFPNGKAFHGLALQPIGGLVILTVALRTGLSNAFTSRVASEQPPADVLPEPAGPGPLAQSTGPVTDRPVTPVRPAGSVANPS